MTASNNTHVVFIHLDLGIGGAESLVLNLAKATLPDDDDAASVDGTDTSHGRISIYTTHCSPTHCYDEVRPPNGRLSSHVHIRGSWIPRNFFYLGGTALCSALRMLYLTYVAVKENPHASVFVIDVLPTGVPYLVECCNVNAGVLFYCHFPDKLLTRDTVNGEQSTGDAKNTKICGESNGKMSSSRVVKYLKSLKRFYRWIMDTAEEWSMSYSDLIVVNSLFTRGEVEKVFPSLFAPRDNTMDEATNNSPQQRGERVRVLYPSIESSLSRERKIMDPNVWVAGQERTNTELDESSSSSGPIVSLNRFERKKNIALVLHAYDVLLEQSTTKKPNSTIIANDDALLLPPLIIAGGYDPLNVENVEYFAELRALADAILNRYNLPPSIVCSSSKSSSVVDDIIRGGKTNGPCIIFLPSISDAKRTALLATAAVWCYTPHREHFGIVPLEAMDAGVPVVAIRSGGPMETIVDGVTGYLVDYHILSDGDTPRDHPTVLGFANAIHKLLSNPSMAKVMGQRGRKRVDDAFGMETFRRTFWEFLSEARERGSRRHRRKCTSYPSLIWSTMRTFGDLGWAVVLAIVLTWALKRVGSW